MPLWCMHLNHTEWSLPKLCFIYKAVLRCKKTCWLKQSEPLWLNLHGASEGRKQIYCSRPGEWISDHLAKVVPLPDNPIRTIKDINMHALSGYRPHQDPSLPWTKFGNYISGESRLNLECSCVVFRRRKAGQNPKKKSEPCTIFFLGGGAGLVQADTIKIKAGPWDMEPASCCSLEMCYFSGVLMFPRPLISNVCTAMPTFNAQTSDVGVCEATGRRRSSSLWFHLLKAILRFPLKSSQYGKMCGNVGVYGEITWKRWKTFTFLSLIVPIVSPPPTEHHGNGPKYSSCASLDADLLYLFFILKNAVILLKGRTAPFLQPHRLAKLWYVFGAAFMAKFFDKSTKSKKEVKKGATSGWYWSLIS